MQTLNRYFLLFIIALFLSACSYTPEEQAKYDEQRAYWRHNNGNGGTNR